MQFEELPDDYALVLQQISEDGGDGIDDLVAAIRIGRDRLMHIVSSLHLRGLITIESMGYDMWLSLSRRGRRFVQYVWPETLGKTQHS